MRRAGSLFPSFFHHSLSSTTAAVSHHRLLQSALFSTSNPGGATATSSSVSRAASIGLAATAAAAAATSFYHHQALAKEAPLADVVPKDVVLYQYEACPFCNKVKAFLDYYDIPYQVVEVNPISKKEIKWSDYKKVPILMVDGDKLVDSSDIIDKLAQKIVPGKSDISASEDDEEKKWRRWVDDHLVHVLSPNIYRSTAEALESFDYITSHGNFSFTEKITVKYAGAAAMYFVSKNLKKKYNITDERRALYDAADTWVDALDGREFLGGSKPNLADLAVFGVLRPIRYLRSGRDMVDHTRIGEWYTRMEGVVGESSRIKLSLIRCNKEFDAPVKEAAIMDALLTLFASTKAVIVYQQQALSQVYSLSRVQEHASGENFVSSDVITRICSDVIDALEITHSEHDVFNPNARAYEAQHHEAKNERQEDTEGEPMNFDRVIAFDDDVEPSQAPPSQYGQEMDPQDPTFETPTHFLHDIQASTPPVPQKT